MSTKMELANATASHKPALTRTSAVEISPLHSGTEILANAFALRENALMVRELMIMVETFLPSLTPKIASAKFAHSTALRVNTSTLRPELASTNQTTAI